MQKDRQPQAYQRADGRWECVAQAAAQYRTESGRPKRIKRTGNTKREAEDAAWAARDAWERQYRRNETEKQDPRRTLGDWMKEYLDVRTQNTEKSTERNYRRNIQTYFIKRPIAKIQPAAATVGDWDRYLRSIEKNYCRSIFSLCSQFSVGLCAYLTKKGVMKENQAAEAGVRWDRMKKTAGIELTAEGEKQKKEILTAEDVRKLVCGMREHREHRYLPAFVFQLETALRESELFALQISDVDTEKKTVCVRRNLGMMYADSSDPSVSAKNTVRYLKRPKNGEIRETKLSALAEEAYDLMLQNLRERCRNNPRGLLLPVFSDGRFCSVSNYQQAFIAACILLDIERPAGMGPHALRKTAISFQNQAPDANVAITAMAAGHRDLRTDIKIYTRQREEALQTIRTAGEQVFAAEKKDAETEEEKEKELMRRLMKKYRITSEN